MATTTLTTVVLTDNGNTIKLVWTRGTDDREQYIPKPYSINTCDIEGTGVKKAYDHAEVVDQTGCRTRIYVHMVTSPIVADLDALAAVLANYNNTATGTGAKFTDTFVNGDLVGNILTVNHALNSTAVGVYVYDNTSVSQLVPVTIIDANNLSIDLGGAIGGTWTIVVIA